MYYRKISKKRRRKRFAIRLLVLGIILLLLTIIIGKQITPTIHRNAVIQTKIISTKILNEALSQTLENLSEGQSDYITLEKKEDGTVSSVQINSITVSKLQTELTEAVIKTLSQLGKTEMSMALGTLLSPTFFAQSGPPLRFYLKPSGNVNTKICSDFSESGINQARHTLSFRVSVPIFCAISAYRTETTVETEFLLSDTVIVGDVPEYYTKVITENESLLNDLNDYVPSPN